MIERFKFERYAMFRFVLSLVLFAVAAWAAWVYANAGENLLFAAGSVVCGLVGMYMLVSPLLKKKTEEG